jgi:hypothetical protein
MPDTIEQNRSLGDPQTADQPHGGDDRPTLAQAMVPMLDWPSDLFAMFTAEVDDEIE